MDTITHAAIHIHNQRAEYGFVPCNHCGKTKMEKVYKIEKAITEGWKHYCNFKCFTEKRNLDKEISLPVKFGAQLPAHFIIEQVYRFTAMANECEWVHLNKIKEIKIFLSHVLIHYLDRALVANLLNIKEHTLATNYIWSGNKKKREDSIYRTRFIMVRRQVNNALMVIEHNINPQSILKPI